ncbi:hypothetical protein GRI40_05705 [Altererythrobacter aerius]|uniref:Uncharacterized protein n=1 Tax=Tsuneonella aeria TaxID=1837929 RepID=A0A6I4TDM1_9SPHN|nr:hypothetical protein [Tsuneonella aeria]MXO74716.1 hypothetical protein [Tsuneonella aeria]
MARKAGPIQSDESAEAAGGISDAGGEVLTRLTGTSLKVPGPSVNPATNLLINDIAIRAGGRLIRHTLEKGLLRGRYGGTGAKAIVENRSLTRSIVSGLLARYATRSVPGAVLIGGGLVAKTLFDRGRKSAAARRSGDRSLRKMAED